MENNSSTIYGCGMNYIALRAIMHNIAYACRIRRFNIGET